MADTVALDAACVSHVLSSVDDGDTMGAALRVSHLWRSCARDAALPFWASLDAQRFRALHQGGEERESEAAPVFCACAAVVVLRSGVGRRLRRLDLSGATVCPRCDIAPGSGFVVPRGTVELALFQQWVSDQVRGCCALRQRKPADARCRARSGELR